MTQLGELLSKQPLVPYIRAAGFAVRKPWTVERRRLLDYLLVFFQEGHCVVELDGIEHTFGPGEFCLVQPGDVHSLHGITDTITPYAHLDIFYHTRREESFSSPPGLLDLSPHRHLMQPRLNDIRGIHVPLRIEPSNVAWFRETLLRMVGVWQQHDPLSQLEAQNLAADLMLSLLRDYSGETAPTAQAPHSLNWITSYLLLHLGDSISVADMAKRAQLSPSRFAAVFRQTFGCAPHVYLLHLRIGHAQELLSNSDSTIEQVARLTGFVSVHHFARTFKKMTGRTPGQWRKMRTTSNGVSSQRAQGTGSETRIGV
jgi:AraC-like DNA-binding protein